MSNNVGDAALQAAAVQRGKPYLIISSDGHAGPSLEYSLRPYCPVEYLDEYDGWVKAFREGQFFQSRRNELSHADQLLAAELSLAGKGALDGERAGLSACMTCKGHDDPYAHLSDLDGEGIASEIVLAGGQNDESLPFIGFGADAGPTAVSGELRSVSMQIWNRWLADFVSVSPERLLGVLQIPVWDIEASVKELERGHEAGIRCVNLPAPRPDFPAYNDRVYDPFFSTCNDLGMTLVTHAGGGDAPLGYLGSDGKVLPGGVQTYVYERLWLARRAMWELIFGGVFARFPNVMYVLAEQLVAWVPETLRDLDNIYMQEGSRPIWDAVPNKPSEYWATNCFNGGSFLSPFEASLRHEVGLPSLLWGSDYPHQEGTWPHTRLALRNTFADIPEDEVRVILGLNALRAFHLDERDLRPIADRIGPSPELISTPLAEDERPEFSYGGRAFRTFEFV